MKDSGIIRVNKAAGDYFAASNKPFNDSVLSWGARGIMGYLLSKPDGWEMRNHDLYRQSPDPENRIDGYIAELKAAGYIRRYRVSLGRGKIEWVTEIYERKEMNPDFTNPEKQAIVKNTNPNFTSVEKYEGEKIGDIVNTESVLITESKTTTTTTRADFLQSVLDSMADILASDDKAGLLAALSPIGPADKLDAVGQAFTDFWHIDLAAVRHKRLARDVALTCQKFGLDSVLWALLVAQSPDRQDGKNKTWGYVKGILAKESNDERTKPTITQPKRGRGRNPADIEREKREQAAYQASIDAALAAARAGRVGIVANGA